jgi:hypothetical protein
MGLLKSKAGEKGTSEDHNTSSTTTTTSHDIPPAYDDPSSSTDPPPTYQSVQRALNSLSHGPPDEMISVPFVTRTLGFSLHNYNPFSHKQGQVRQIVVTRQMKRSQYLAHYVKDADGNFIGTGRPAPDAELVFVPSKGSDEDMLRQAEAVALKVQKLRGKGIGDWGQPLSENYMGHAGVGGGTAM